MKLHPKLLSAILVSILQFSASSSMAANSAAAVAGSQARHLAFVAAPIKTSDDLREYLETIGHRSSPLKKLSENSRKRFTESITFNEEGVTGFYAADIESELTPTQTYQLLALFGAQDLTSRLTGLKSSSSQDKEIMGKVTPTVIGSDYKDYKCISRGTCESSLGFICTANC